MNALGPVEAAVAEGKIPRDVLEGAKEGVEKLSFCIAKVEKASKVRYPAWYAMPAAVLMSGGELQEQAILFSRFIPVTRGNSLEFYVEFTLPLILYASKDTLTAVAAHELLHYLNFLSKVKDMRISSSEIGTSSFEAGYIDEEELLSPERVFRSKAIIRLLATKFSGGLNDQPLIKRTITKWVKKGLPVVTISPEENVTRLSMASILSFVPDDSVKRVLNWT